MSNVIRLTLVTLTIFIPFGDRIGDRKRTGSGPNLSPARTQPIVCVQ